MNRQTQYVTVVGPAGNLQCAIDEPTTSVQGLALLCHPHPLHGGTMNNKVVQTLARAFLSLGYRCVRFNFRGVEESQGVWDQGQGEIDDAAAVLAALRTGADTHLPIALGGFSFGAYVAANLAQRWAHENPEQATLLQPLTLVGTAVTRFHVPAVGSDSIVVHGQADDVVELQPVLQWAAPQNLPVHVIPDVGHFFHGQLALLRQTIVQAWLGRVAWRQLQGSVQ